MRAALEAVVLEALRRRPCTVSFSGGRDSSAVLAVAVDVAQRHGLEPPVPVTIRWPHAPESDESEWQELVVRHLGLTEWEIVDGEPHLDAVGDTAAAMLDRHGLLFPPAAYMQRLLFSRSRGGAALSGLGGDQLLGEWRWQRAADVLGRRARPRARDAAVLANWLAPQPARRAVARRRGGRGLPWLREAPRRELAGRLRAERVSEPRTWPGRVEWLARRRALAHSRHATTLLAADDDAVCIHPLLDPRVTAALARAGGRYGWGGRTGAMRALFGDLLPPALLERTSKAGTSRAYEGPATSAFVASWDGGGVDPELVDPGELRRAWSPGEAQNGRAILQLQAAWLLTRRGGPG